MTLLSTIAIYVSLAVSWVWIAVQVAAALMGLWALIDALMQPAQYFVAADKRTKGLWVGVNAAGLAVVALMGASSMLGLLGVVANAVYMTDVRPAVNLYKPVTVRSRIRRPGEGGPGTFFGR